MMMLSSRTRQFILKNAARDLNRRQLSNTVNLYDPTLLPRDSNQIKPSADFGFIPATVNYELSDEKYGPRKPVSSAMGVDVSVGEGGVVTGKVSAKHAISVSADGSKIAHGGYAELSLEQCEGIPLEYLALVGKAAEGAAALRTVMDGKSDGTILVYGATMPEALAAVQLANAAGIASIAVVSSDHSGNAEAVNTVKEILNEPSAAVGEEFVLKKSSFRGLVKATSEGESDADAQSDIVSDFIANYQTVNDTVSETDLKEKFTAEQYSIFKHQFKNRQDSLLCGNISGTFEPVNVVRDTVRHPQNSADHPHLTNNDFDFSLTNISKNKTKGAGPIRGAIITATPSLQAAFEAVSKCKTNREKVEALQCLPHKQKNAYSVASAIAKAAVDGQVVVVGGSLTGMSNPQIVDQDFTTALDAMRIDENTGSSSLNFFVQVFRAGDFPAYEDYAIHKATEVLAGPRQVVITK